jgi:Flp pilus assembly protein TadD
VEYQAAVKLAPAEPRPVTELAQLYEAHGRADDAIATYEALYKRNPHLQFAANNLAILLVTYKTDSRSLDRARDLTGNFSSSGDSSLLDTSGWVHVKRGEYGEALPVLERAIERAPDQKQIRYHLAVAELHVGQKERARVNLQSALSGSTNYPWSKDARVTLASLGGPAG